MVQMVQTGSKPIRLSALLMMGALCFAGTRASQAAPARNVLKVNPAPYLGQLARIGGNLRDFQATLDARMAEAGSKRAMTFKMNIFFKLPDSFRADVVHSSSGMFRNWKFARVGSNVTYYDPISERSASTDINKIAGFKPMRVDMGIDMFAGIFRPHNYTVQSSAPTKIGASNAVLLHLKPKPGFGSPRDVVRLSHILVWMDPAKKAPIKQATYGWFPGEKPTHKNLKQLIVAQFGGYKAAGPGLWYPTVVNMTRKGSLHEYDSPNKVRLNLTRVNNVLVPSMMSVAGEGGSSTLNYSNIRVNTNLPPATFRPRA